MVFIKKFLSAILSLLMLVEMLSSFSMSAYAYGYDCGQYGRNHSLSTYSNWDGTHTTECEYCNYEKTENCNLSIVSNEDGTHYYFCNECYFDDYEECSYEYTIKSGFQHQVHCLVCDYRDTHYAEVYCDINGTHRYICYECDYEKNEKCKLQYTPWSVDYHKTYCEICENSDFDDHTFKKVSIKKSTPNQKGSVNYKCSKCGKSKTKTISRIKSVSLSKTEYVYDGKVKKPIIKIRDYNGNVINAENYTVKYASGRKNVGTYKVTVTFKGEKYSGTISKNFKILPPATSISSISASKNSISLKWNKKISQVSGYEIRYSQYSDMSPAKKITISSNKTTSKTITGLSYNNKYYCQIRTYKTINGNKYYSKWSSKKSKTTPAKKKSSSGSSSHASQQSTGSTVYVTATGSCYHRYSQCGNGRYYESTLSHAKSIGLRPCKKCF